MNLKSEIKIIRCIVAGLLAAIGLGCDASGSVNHRSSPTRLPVASIQVETAEPPLTSIPDSFRASETDAASPRYSKLNAANLNDVVRLDVDGDGDVDILEAWWNGRRCRWFDENDNMALNDVRGDRIDDALQVDRDGDGYYDGPGDLNVDWVDNDGDGDSDLQVIITHPKANAKMLAVGESNYMVFFDSDDDDVNAYIDWETFDFPCWRTQGRSNFSPDYNGDSLFLKVHAPAFAVTDPRLNWENPFAFYDFDDDGCTEMTIRYVDAPVTVQRDGQEEWKLSGKANEVFVSYDLDNDAQAGNELDLDMTLHFGGGAHLPYDTQVNFFPKLKAPEWVLPYYRYTNWRMINELIYMPKELCHEKAFEAQWGRVSFIFDEDDDDHRWERVELYYPHDPYVINSDHNKNGPDGKPQKSMTWHPQCDQLGDRGEFDHDASGRGQLYIAAWDNKIHLYGAEKGTWLVDRNAEFFGSPNTPPATIKKRPTRVAEVVHYKDTNANGFLDLIEYDYDGDTVIDFSLSLLEFGSDESPIVSPGDVEWEGLHVVYGKLAKVSWKQAQELYEVIWEKGLNDQELDDLAIAASTAEKHRNAYWLKQKVLRKLCTVYVNDPVALQELKRIFVTHDYKALAVLLER